MGGPRIDIAPELVVEGKRLYERTQTAQQDIAALMGISRDTLHRRVREWGWRRRPMRSRTLDLLHAVRGAVATTATEPQTANAAGTESISPERCSALAERIMTAVEQQLTVIGRMVEKFLTSDDELSDNHARILAGIAHTLREITPFTRPEELTPPHDAKDDSLPLDVDALRNELARRLNALIEARTGAVGGGHGGPGTRDDAAAN
jgi:hypothetical protein